jgi:acetyltransferase-like isoleucine patch superfamily enzyme
LFDLASEITIEDHAAISAQVTFVTHTNVGDQPLRRRFPYRDGPIIVRRGAWLGVNTTVLQGVCIGEYAAVGAMSLVNKDVPANCKSFGIPCQVTQQFPDLQEADMASATTEDLPGAGPPEGDRVK